MRIVCTTLLVPVAAAIMALPGCGAPEAPEGPVTSLTQGLRDRDDDRDRDRDRDCDQEQGLIAWGAVPSAERTPGPTSGQFITPALGVIPPFFDAQPIPGFSGFLKADGGKYIGMPDNGYGAKGNSADYVIGFYVVNPHFKTKSDGTTAPGTATTRTFVAFNDRKGLLKNGKGVDLTITADRKSYFSGAGAGTDSGIAVDADIVRHRLLTGYDFDVESIARDDDGSYWVGEEFGPYILHFNEHGTLIDEPAPHPFLKSPSNPDVLAGRAAATLGGSRGFESLAFDHRGRYLYAVPEAAPTVDNLRPVPGDERVLEIFEFDAARAAYTGRTFKYRKEGNAVGNAIVIGDMTSIAPDVFVLIERDFFWGASAVLKRLYLINLGVTDKDGVLKKTLLQDLLDIDDPRDIGGPLPGLADGKFSMPFDSIECVLKIDDRTLAIALDTNYPFEDGRVKGAPDNTEVIQIRFNQPIERLAPRR